MRNTCSTESASERDVETRFEPAEESTEIVPPCVTVAEANRIAIENGFLEASS